LYNTSDNTEYQIRIRAARVHRVVSRPSCKNVIAFEQRVAFAYARRVVHIIRSRVLGCPRHRGPVDYISPRPVTLPRVDYDTRPFRSPIRSGNVHRVAAASRPVEKIRFASVSRFRGNAIKRFCFFVFLRSAVGR